MREMPNDAGGELTPQLRIAILSDAMSERNGVGVYYADLQAHLTARTERCELISPPHCAEDGPAFRSVPMPGDPTQRLYLPQWRAISKRVLQLAPDIIIVATPGPYAFLGVRLARRLGIPLCVGFHTNFDSLADMYWTNVSGIICRSVLSRIHWALFRAADVVVCHSGEMIELADKTGARRSALAGTPLGPTFVNTPVTPIERVRRVVFAGRLAPEKNLQLFLDAVEACSDLDFTIAGDGPLRDTVEAYSQKLPNLSYLGWQPRDGIRQAIDDSDMLVLPSKVESFGTIALEAMSRQRMVLVSPRCGILDHAELRAGLNAMMPNETVPEAIRRVANSSPAVVQRMTQAGRQAAVQLNDRTITNWLELLGALAPLPRTAFYKLPLHAVKWLKKRRQK